VSVPEATVDEDQLAFANKDQVWFAGQMSAVEPTSEAHRSNQAAYGEFRLSAFPADQRHPGCCQSVGLVSRCWHGASKRSRWDAAESHVKRRIVLFAELLLFGCGAWTWQVRQ
jgi:hypothetical protein